MTDRDVVNLIGIAGLSLAVLGAVFCAMVGEMDETPKWVGYLAIFLIALGVAGCTGGCTADQYYKEKGKVQNGAKVSG